MLALAVRLGGGRVCLYRIVTGALAGASIAALARGVALSRGWTLLLWPVTAMLMMVIARGSMRQSIRHALLLFCAAGLLGGMMLLFLGAMGSTAGAYVLGCMFAAVAGSCAVRAGRAVQDVLPTRIICMYRGEKAMFEAIIDSGNTLRDYLTHLPVIVLPEAAKRRLGLEGVPMRPIFADTAGGRQMMDCLTLRSALVIMHGKAVRVRACAAFSPGLPASAPALLPQALVTACMKESGHRAGDRADQEGKIYGNAEE